MLSLLLQVVKQKPTIEEIVISIQAGEGDEEAFIAQYGPFIRSTVASVRNRYITLQDDEYSIGLYAFHEAIQQYSYKKGSSFLAFAKLLIKRDVIDYIRKEMRQSNVLLQEEEERELDSQQSISDYLQEMDTENRKEEILHFQGVLKTFKISFSELVNESPKHQDTRKDLIKVAKTIVQEEEMVEQLFRKKKLPLKNLQQKVEMSRKTLERHRKYIVALCLIFINSYTYIKEYIGEG